MRIRCGLLGLALLLAVGAWAAADEKSTQLLEQAIAAHQATKLEKLTAATWKGKGTVRIAGMKIPFTGPWLVAGRDKMRIELQMEIAEDKVTVLNIYNGKEGWTVFGGELNDLDQEGLEEMKEVAHVNWAQSLWPLWDKAYKLSPVPDITIDGKTAQGFKVSREGHRDFTFYFDAQSHLLVKCTCQARDEESHELVQQEEFYSNYKEVAGIKVPMMYQIKRAGEMFLEAETSAYIPAEKLEDKLFQKPEK
jgi:hypothetical protein